MTSQALTVLNAQQLVALSDYSTEELSLIKQTICKGPANRPATDLELAFFLYDAKSRGLNPFAKQIYAIWRAPQRGADPVMVIQTGIDGFRGIAARPYKNGHPSDYAGTDNPEYGPMVNSDNCLHPEYASVTGYKMVSGQRVPIKGIAYWDEFYQELNPIWRKMPRNQLSKCAEAQMLRKGWPEQLEGVELGELADVESAPLVEPPPDNAPVRLPASQQTASAAAQPYRNLVPNPDDPPTECWVHGQEWKQGQYGWSHPTDEPDPKKPDKNLWCQRKKVLGDKVVLHANDLGWDREVLTAHVKTQYGKPSSGLNDWELWETANRLRAEFERQQAAAGATDDEGAPESDEQQLGMLGNQ